MIEAQPDAIEAAPDQPPVVSVDHVGVAYTSNKGTFHALSDVSLNVAQGEFISLIGPSGCGKTTLLRLIADLAQPTSGTLHVNGGTPYQARTDRSYGYVFQSPAAVSVADSAQQRHAAARDHRPVGGRTPGSVPPPRWPRSA